MEIVSQLGDIQYEKSSVVSVGVFDGIHLAHQQLLRQVVDHARARNGRSVVLTFDPHPREVLAGKPTYLLTPIDEREAICRGLGIDLFFRISFTYEFSRQSSREFYLRYVVKGSGVSEVVEGYDHHFGRDREGSVGELLKLGGEFGFSVTTLQPVYVDQEVVSSSQIRQHLLQGNVERAERLLGRPYSVKGAVVRGDSRGRELGYPTANLRLVSDRKLIPQDGIYFGSVDLGGKTVYGMASIGVRPTFFAHGERTVEVNLLDFEGDLYGQTLTLDFLRRLRDEKKFDSAHQLVDQMRRDEEESRRLQEHFRRRSPGADFRG